MVSLSLCVLSSSLGTSSANVALPTLARVFGAPFSAVQWVVLAYLVAITSSIVAFGRLGDALGRRRTLYLASSIFCAASIACSVAPVLSILILARALQGLGAAGMMALAVAFASEVVPKDRTGSAMGLLGAMSSVGTALGPSLGGLLVGAIGWRAVFVAHFVLGSLALVLLGRDEPRARKRSARAPLLPVPTPALITSLAASAIVSCVVMTSMVVGPFYLSIALGLDAARVGLTMSVGSLVAALTGFPAGRVVDRFGTRPTTLMGLAGIAFGAIVLSLRPEHLGVPGYVAPMAALTASYALFSAANNAAVMQHVAPEERGVVSGTLSLSRNLGLVAGTCVMGAVFALGTGAHDVTIASPHAVSQGLRTAYGVATALAALAFALVFTTKGRER